MKSFYSSSSVPDLRFIFTWGVGPEGKLIHKELSPLSEEDLKPEKKPLDPLEDRETYPLEAEMKDLSELDSEVLGDLNVRPNVPEKVLQSSRYKKLEGKFEEFKDTWASDIDKSLAQIDAQITSRPHADPLEQYVADYYDILFPYILDNGKVIKIEWTSSTEVYPGEDLTNEEMRKRLKNLKKNPLLYLVYKESEAE